MGPAFPYLLSTLRSYAIDQFTHLSTDDRTNVSPPQMVKRSLMVPDGTTVITPPNVSRFYCVARLLTSEAYLHDNPRL